MCDDEGPGEMPRTRAVRRLREIARVLGRPLTDFLDPVEAEPERPSDDDAPPPDEGET